MKFCANCGNGNDDDSKFCRKCGHVFGSAGGDTIIGQPPPAPVSMDAAAMSAINTQATSSVPRETPLPEPRASDTGTTSLQPNIAHFLCYVALWVTGIIFLIIEKKDRATHFHAWQSIITFGGISIITMLMSLMFAMVGAVHWLSVSWFLLSALSTIVYVGTVVLWIVLMVKAFQGDDYQLPVVGAIAHNLAYKDLPAEKPGQAVTPAPVATPVDLPPLPAKKGPDKAAGTKFCISCGESLPLKAVFCSRCGEKQP